VFHENINYANDTVQKHLLDIYLPPNAAKSIPLVIWLHGGAWNHNDKYADMNYMKQTVKQFVADGYAFASIDYRQTTTKPSRRTYRTVTRPFSGCMIMQQNMGMIKIA
jgi:acetyl esterase/lipase